MQSNAGTPGDNAAEDGYKPDQIIIIGGQKNDYHNKK